MSDSRTKNVSRNVFFAFSRGLLNTILPFITRTVTLYLLGDKYLGLGTLFTSVLSMLNLTELGISSAINFVMYKPIAQGDDEVVSVILWHFRRVYRIIGGVILVIGTLIVPVIPYLISGETPSDLNIYVLYYIYLINTSISYFFAGYRQCLLTSNQRSDIISKITMGVYIFNNVFQVLVLVVTRNYYIFAIVPIAGTLLTNLLVARITKKRYPNISCRGEISDEIKLQIKKRMLGLFGTKLNSLVVHQADTLVVSAFLGLTIVTEYGNYYFVLNAVCAFTTVFFSSFTASIGNKLVKDSVEDNYIFFKRLNGLNSWLIGLCSAWMIVLFQPFMEIWVGKKLMQPFLFVILVVVYFYSFEIQRTVLTYKDAAGLWYEDRIRPYITMIFNVFSNLVLVQIIGIYGIVVSSIVAFCISIPWTNQVLFKCLFHRSPLENLKRMAIDLAVNTILIVICYYACINLRNGLIWFAVRIIVTFVIFNLGYFVLYFRNDTFRYWINVIRNAKGKLLMKGPE